MKNTTASAVSKVAVVAAYTVMLVSTVAYRRSRMPAAQAVEQTKTSTVVVAETTTVAAEITSVCATEVTEEVKYATSKKVQQTTATTQKETRHSNATYYRIPMSEYEQGIVLRICKKYNLNPSLVYAVIWQESDFNKYCDTGKCHGLMQISECNYKQCGIKNVYDIEENVNAGCLMLSELISKYDSVTLALMAYNNGEAGAKRLWDDGIYSTSYTRNVLSKQVAIESGNYA